MKAMFRCLVTWWRVLWSQNSRNDVRCKAIARVKSWQIGSMLGYRRWGSLLLLLFERQYMYKSCRYQLNDHAGSGFVFRSRLEF